MKHNLLLFVLLLSCVSLMARTDNFEVVRTAGQTYGIAMKLKGKTLLTSPKEGLWSVATTWENDWMGGWKHAAATEVKKINEWTVLSGNIDINGEKMSVSDAYRMESKGVVKVVRRYQWKGQKVLKKANLSVRYQLKGEQMQTFMPGILYYGNPAGAKVNDQIIPVYTAQKGEFAIFEEHRFPIPFAMLENSTAHYGAAIHSIPTPVKGGALYDQWWSMGVEAKEDCSELVLYSGPIGYNKKRSVAKALQRRQMRYTDAYIEMKPGDIVEKIFYLELFAVEQKGSGFQRPLYTALDLFKPYDVQRFPSFEKIVSSKLSFALNRWLDEQEAVGFDMYEPQNQKDIVMGWCGQAAAPGFALQWLSKYSTDKHLKEKVQTSLDFLTNYPMMEGRAAFKVGYQLDKKQYYGGDAVSCGQAMYNFAKAIESAWKHKTYKTERWEAFLKEACDRQSNRILQEDWRPYSTAEGFYIAPLAIAAKLFKNKRYKKAALKAGEVLTKRHWSMEEPYWGGTLDATCEDKEGAWAAFQGFLELYERFGERRYLERAKHAMDVCLSYVVVWDIPLPAGRLADHNFKTMGWTVVSPQNQHLDVYGVLFAPEVYKMGVHLKDERLLKLAKIMYRSCFQLADPKGSQGEQIQQTNFAQHGDMSDIRTFRGGYVENWTVFWITAHFLNAAARFEEMDVQP